MVILASTYDQSKFLRAEDLQTEKRFRIKGVSEELVGQGADQSKKLVVWFTNSPKGLALNRTNNRTIRGAFGDDTAGWTGKVISIFPTIADFRGRPVGALRVRIPAPKESVQHALNSFAAAPTVPEQKPVSAPATAPATTPAPTAAVQPEPDPDLDDEIPF
jgi:hypothetical protein